MKKYITAVLLISVFATISCVKNLEDEGISISTDFVGTVVAEDTMQPLSGVKVKITFFERRNGVQTEKTYASTETGDDGSFAIKDINLDNMDKNTEYYLLIDGSSINYEIKRKKLKGFGVAQYDYGEIVLNAYGDSHSSGGDSLPTFTYGGHKYMVAPDPHTSADQLFSWASANTYCEGLDAFGYSDWRMPTIEELEVMYQNRESIGGFYEDCTIEGVNYLSVYHSSTIGVMQTSGYEGQSGHYTIIWGNGYRIITPWLEYEGYHDWGSSGLGRAHVRPIRIDM